MTEFRTRRLARRVLALLAVSRVPLSQAQIWMIVGGSSGAVYRALEDLTKSGKAIRQMDDDSCGVCYSAVIAGLPPVGP